MQLRIGSLKREIILLNPQPNKSKEREREDKTKIRDEKADITTDTPETQRIVREYV